MPVDTFSLAGKVAIVTGSGRENGIGAAIAYAFARNGAAVTITHVSDTSASRAAAVADKVRDLGGKAIVVQANLETRAGGEKVVQETLKGFGVDKIDILVNNAGGPGGHGILSADVSEDIVQKAFSANFLSALYMYQAAVSHVRDGGRIVNIGSTVGREQDLRGLSIYGAAKAAMEFLTGAWATELGGRGITVNNVAPGPTMGTDAGTWFEKGPQAEELLKIAADRFRSGTRLGGRPGTVDEIADAVLLVVSPQARWITGQYIAASGGLTQ